MKRDPTIQERRQADSEKDLGDLDPKISSIEELMHKVERYAEDDEILMDAPLHYIKNQ